MQLEAFIHAIPWFWKFSVSFVILTAVENLSPSIGSPPMWGTLAIKMLIFWPKEPSSYLLPITVHYPLSTIFLLFTIPSVPPPGSPVGTCKLGQLKPFLGSLSSCSRLEVSLACLRIGHTRLAHDHLMARESPPIYDRCYTRLSIFHVLVECSVAPAYFVPHNRFFPFLTSVSPRERLSFLLSESLTRLRVPQRYSTGSAASCWILPIK